MRRPSWKSWSKTPGTAATTSQRVGAGAKKQIECFTVTPAHRCRPADAIDFRDDRPPTSTALTLHPEAMDVALAAAGVVVGPDTVIKLRLRPQTASDQQGQVQQLGTDSYRIVVHVADKPQLADRHLYVVNNSLLHELRHVAQMQHDPDHHAKYAQQNLTVGYQHNSYEVEARWWGRLADHTAAKPTGPAGPALGKAAWALRPPAPAGPPSNAAAG